MMFFRSEIPQLFLATVTKASNNAYYFKYNHTKIIIYINQKLKEIFGDGRISSSYSNFEKIFIEFLFY
jgi:hypothetical protein